jgi:AbrB family looped-hinge helix DNA binding protein
METVGKIDSSGRVLIPKELRERYGFSEGAPVRIITLPDGVSIIAQERERRFIRRGPILCIDTRAETAGLEEFDVDRLRRERLDAKSP